MMVDQSNKRPNPFAKDAADGNHAAKRPELFPKPATNSNQAAKSHSPFQTAVTKSGQTQSPFVKTATNTNQGSQPQNPFLTAATNNSHNGSNTFTRSGFAFPQALPKVSLPPATAASPQQGSRGIPAVSAQNSGAGPGQDSSSIQAELERYKKDLAALKDRTAALEGRTDGMQPTIRGVQDSVAKMQAEVAAVQASTEKLRSEILKDVREEIFPEVRNEVRNERLQPKPDASHSMAVGAPTQTQEQDAELVLTGAIQKTRTFDVKQEPILDDEVTITERQPSEAFVRGRGAEMGCRGRRREHAASDHVLWAPDDETAFVAKLAPHHPLVVLPRRMRGHDDGEGLPGAARGPPAADYRQYIVEVEYLIRAPGAPRHLLVVGEIWKRRTRANRLPPDYSSTNYYLMMDVAKRSLWVVYAYEHLASPGGFDAEGGAADPQRYELGQRETFPGVEPFDIACLVADIYDIVEIKEEYEKDQGSGPQLSPRQARQKLNNSGRIVRPVFTEMLVDNFRARFYR
ncbi:hypothetical protein F4818DRAFT_451488 [Hypoxylon cercidicola]|nr:hypothetical protein F4818DRAFT_451488 [Hypoxylon cercidicola]